ncbi:MAG: rod shape-determining protein MreD [Candidatus Omnitrophica bacterium]|nr:rod shape-determining protein MreD [Candidatus Omnitrophota bacterium]
MRKLLLITILVFIFFMIEFLIFNLLGRMFMPNLMIILVVFANLAFGIRYSLYTGFLAGFIKDSFSIGLFGINICSFIICAFLTTFIQNKMYRRGSPSSRLLLIFMVASINVFVHFILEFMFYPFSFIFVLQHIYLPEILATLFVTTFTFQYLRRCVLKFSV